MQKKINKRHKAKGERKKAKGKRQKAKEKRYFIDSAARKFIQFGITETDGNTSAN